jgi:histidyl-tRNA synthetase
MSGLKMAGKLEPASTTIKAIVLAMPGVPVPELLKVAAELRAADIATAVYFGKTKTSITDQFAFANSCGIPVAVLLGEDELKGGKISVKDLKMGMEKRADIKDREAYRKASRAGQATGDRSELIKLVKGFLAQTAESASA